MKLNVQSLFHQGTNTFTYVVWDLETRDAVVIDPVWDFNMDDYTLTNESAQKVLDLVKENSLRVHYILETHVHADHLTSSQLLKAALGNCKIAINKNISKVQKVFKEILQLDDLRTDGSQFDELLDEEKVVQAGSLRVQTIFTPGHTPACSCFLIGDVLFSGDSIFMPDFGTGRCDFPEGSAQELYSSITDKIYSLPDETRIFVGHDYGPGGRAIANETTVGEERAKNIHVTAQTSAQEFVSFRTQRDSTLKPPKLIYPSLQVNLRAGHLPQPLFFKMPVVVK